MIPNGSTVLEPGSTVLIVTKPGSLHQVIDFIEVVNNLMKLSAILFSNCFYLFLVSVHHRRSTEVTI
jgi:hypothetical protein